VRYIDKSTEVLQFPEASLSGDAGVNVGLLDTGWDINWPGPGHVYLSDRDIVDILIAAKDAELVVDALKKNGWTAPGETDARSRSSRSRTPSWRTRSPRRRSRRPGSTRPPRSSRRRSRSRRHASTSRRRRRSNRVSEDQYEGPHRDRGGRLMARSDQASGGVAVTPSDVTNIGRPRRSACTSAAPAT
jgi:hypothetical protein